MPEKIIYLDNNATTHVDKRVIDVIAKEFAEDLGNASSIHSYGRAAKAKLSTARRDIANFLGVKTEEIIFTSGGTEGANLLIRGVVGSHAGGHIISTTLEHAAVFETLKSLCHDRWKCTFINPGEYGAATPEQVRAALQSDTKAIVLMAVNNETGVKTDIDSMCAIAQEVSIPLIVDGVALLGKESFKIASGISGMFFSGHKLHGPKGVGIAYIKGNLKLSSICTGGDQEYRRRGGTENLPAILGLAEAVRILREELPGASERILRLREKFEHELSQQLPHCRINGLGPRSVNTSSIAFPGVEGELLLTKLDLAGVAASHGSACASGGLEPSRVLINMGIPMDIAASSIRFSLSRMTTELEIDAAMDIIVKYVQGLTY